jgi:peptide/nickel transport system substrate-binding protein
MVRNADLAPLAERLPVKAAIVEPVDGIGQYGGTWNTALIGGSDTAWLVRTVSYIHPMAWTSQRDGVAPNAVESARRPQSNLPLRFPRPERDRVSL